MSTALAGLILSMAILVSVAMALAIFKMDTIGTLAVLLGVLVLLVAMQWTPYWVLILICLLIAAMFGARMAGWFTGKTAGGG